MEVCAMTVSYASEVTINRPLDDVFPYIIEPTKQALWSDVPMRRLDGEDGAMRPGSRIEVSFGMGPMKAKVGLEMVAVEDGRRMAWRTFSGPIKWEGEYVLEPAAGGTRLSQHGTLTFTGLWRLMESMAGREIQSGEVKELEKLKSVVEGEPGAS
jgi:uncharacterized protein YndB with AHSA1/START domain